MPKQLKRGRPKLKNRRVIMVVSLSFDPATDAHILAQLANAPKGKRAEVALQMMRNGAGAQTAPESTVAPKFDVLAADDSEFI